MKKILFLTASLSLFVGYDVAAATTANQYISQGRAYLASSNLVSANLCFSNATLLSPTQQTGSVLRAATRLLLVPSQPAVSNFLTRLGMSTTGRSVYGWTAKLPTDTNGVPLAPAGVDANETTALLRTNVLATLIGADTNLAAVTSTNFVLYLTTDDTQTEYVTMDYGDVQLLRALVEWGECLIYNTYSWNLDVQLSALRSFYTNHQFDLGDLLASYPHLLTFASTTDLSAAKTAFTNAANHYLLASQFIRGRPWITPRLFNYNPEKANAEENFRLTLEDLVKSLKGSVTLQIDAHYSVFLPALFAGTHSPRSFLPEFRGANFLAETWGDPTFGGLVGGVSPSQLDTLLGRGAVPIPELLAPSGLPPHSLQFQILGVAGRGYVVQVSSNLVNWADYAAVGGLASNTPFMDQAVSSLSHRFYRVVDRTTNMPPPVNDKFANRASLQGSLPSATGYTFSATTENGEPGWSEYSIWYSWTAPLNETVIVSPAGSAVSANVSVYTGSVLTNLTEVDYEPDYPWHYDGALFGAVAGTTYMIQVTTGKPGGIKLQIGVPTTITFQGAQDGTRYPHSTNLTLSATAASSDASITGLQISGDSRVLATTNTSSLSVGWALVDPGDHNIEVTATDALGITAYYDVSVTIVPANDLFANRTPISTIPAILTGSNAGGRKESGEPNHAGDPGGASVWWSWTSSFSGTVSVYADLLDPWDNEAPLLAVYTGTALSSLRVVATNNPAGLIGPAHVKFVASAGVTYQIAVDGQYGTTGDITLRLIHSTPPVVSITAPKDGDQFLAPTNLTLTATASDSDGSVSLVEFLDADNTLPALIGTALASPYTNLWRSSKPGYYTIVARATDNSGAFAYSGTVGITILSPPPPNDNFPNRITISGSTASVYGSNAAATKEPGEPNHAGTSGGSSVWWTWTAPRTGTVTISTFGSNFDTLLGVYTGTSVSSLTTAASNDDYGGQQTSLVSFEASAGVAYQITVDGYYGETGSITLNVSQP